MTHERDDTPTHPAPIDVLSAQLDAFRKDPGDGDAFAELRAALPKPALYHRPPAWQLQPDRTAALGAARTISPALGDDGMVGKLYQAELDALPGGERGHGPHAARIPHALGRLAHKHGDAAAAATHLEK